MSNPQWIELRHMIRLLADLVHRLLHILWVHVAPWAPRQHHTPLLCISLFLLLIVVLVLFNILHLILFIELFLIARIFILFFVVCCRALAIARSLTLFDAGLLLFELFECLDFRYSAPHISVRLLVVVLFIWVDLTRHLFLLFAQKPLIDSIHTRTFNFLLNVGHLNKLITSFILRSGD